MQAHDHCRRPSGPWWCAYPSAADTFYAVYIHHQSIAFVADLDAILRGFSDTSLRVFLCADIRRETHNHE
jgi:hypothetical protein